MNGRTRSGAIRSRGSWRACSRGPTCRRCGARCSRISPSPARRRATPRPGAASAIGSPWRRRSWPSSACTVLRPGAGRAHRLRRQLGGRTRAHAARGRAADAGAKPADRVAARCSPASPAVACVDPLHQRDRAPPRARVTAVSARQPRARSRVIRARSARTPIHGRGRDVCVGWALRIRRPGVRPAWCSLPLGCSSPRWPACGRRDHRAGPTGAGSRAGSESARRDGRGHVAPTHAPGHGRHPARAGRRARPRGQPRRHRGLGLGRNGRRRADRSSVRSRGRARSSRRCPGLIVTQHSGDGKANQYFLRGFNLDHGTDFATSSTACR